MTDLELIIKELEERIENFKKDAELGPLEPDGHYTLKDIQILKSQLRTFQYFHPEHKKLVEKQDRKRQDEIRETVLRNALISKLKWLSEKTLSLEEYEQKLTQIIKSHMRHLQAKTRVESKEPEEINLADSDTDSTTAPRQSL